MLPGKNSRAGFSEDLGPEGDLVRGKHSPLRRPRPARGHIAALRMMLFQEPQALKFEKQIASAADPPIVSQQILVIERDHDPHMA